MKSRTQLTEEYLRKLLRATTIQYQREINDITSSIQGKYPSSYCVDICFILHCIVIYYHRERVAEWLESFLSYHETRVQISRWLICSGG